MGMARTFQVTRPFAGMTCLENVMVAAINRHPQKPRAFIESFAREKLGLTGLDALAAIEARHLNVIQKKRLELARALATEPKLLMLDEVLGGLNTQEIGQAVDFIRRLRDEAGAHDPVDRTRHGRDHAGGRTGDRAGPGPGPHGGDADRSGERPAGHPGLSGRVAWLRCWTCRMSICYRGETQVLWDICLSVEPGERVAILGSNGAGKSSFLAAVTADADPRARATSASTACRWSASARTR